MTEIGEWDGAFYLARRDGYEIRFVPGAGESLDEVCNVDMWVIRADGERWSGTAFTHDEVGRLLERWRRSGECLDGGYFWASDGLIVREPGIPSMVSVIDHLVETGEYTSVLQRLQPEDHED